jgi:ATP-binding protein involved in chromosome partitioning
MFKQTGVPVLGVVENMSYYINSHGEKEFIFGEAGGVRFSEELGLPLLAQVPLLPAVRQHADQGLPIVLADPDSEPAQELRKATQSIVATLCERSIATQNTPEAQPPVAEKATCGV